MGLDLEDGNAFDFWVSVVCLVFAFWLDLLT